MRRVCWHIAGRFFEARAERAYRKYLGLKGKAEKFFRRLDSDQDD